MLRDITGGQTPASRRYALRTIALMAVYVLANVAAIFGLFDGLQHTPAAWVLAAAVALPVAGQIWATLALMRESDEFVRGIIARRR